MSRVPTGPITRPLLRAILDQYTLDPAGPHGVVHAACEGHTHGGTVADVTVQTCWDADRLDLGRVGVRPLPRYLCTPPARAAETISWAHARATGRVVPELLRSEWGLDSRGRPRD
ncbi:hypothetical protein K8I85_14180 [bacterium]|nr:hypothetical protein [bacterium]